jgi:hypothetical protein
LNLNIRENFILGFMENVVIVRWPDVLNGLDQILSGYHYYIIFYLIRLNRINIFFDPIWFILSNHRLIQLDPNKTIKYLLNFLYFLSNLILINI